MALAARPSTVPSADPRTACPVCGGTIHPIAGRCKHCKTDLVKLRRQQAAQAAALHAHQAADPFPSPFARPRPAPAPVPAPMARPLAPSTSPAPAAPAPAPTTAAGSAPTVAPAAAPAPAPLVSLPELYLPPEPVRQSAWSRAWPIVVAIVAAAAIIVCLILLVTGGDKHDAGTRQLQPPPAPDRMNTNPLTQDDPWRGTQPPAAGNTTPPPIDPTPAPPAGGGLAGNTAPPPPPAPPPPDPDDQGGVVGGVVGGSGSGPAVPPPERFNASMFQTMCDRLKTCGTLAPEVSQVCDELSSMTGLTDDDQTQQRIASGEFTYDKDKAATCLGMLSRIPCSRSQMDIGHITQLMTEMTGCTDALECH